MPLDLEPVLDLAPVGDSNDAAPNGLNLEPIDQAKGLGPELRETQPESLGKKVLRKAREALTPLIGPSPEEMMENAWGVDGNGRPIYKPAGSKVEQEGFLPALSHPFVPIPRAPSWPKGEKVPLNLYPEVAGAALYNTAANFVEFAESPLGMATGGLGGAATKAGVPAINRIMAGGYAADIARHVPEQARQLGELSVTGTPQEIMEAGAGLGSSIVLPGALAGGAVVPGGKPGAAPAPKIEATKTKLDLEPVSEFGGVLPPPSGQGGVEKTVPGATGEAVLGGTVPESPETLSAQLEWLKQGKRKAVLVTPGEEAPEIPAGMKAHTTSDGTFIYDPAKVSAEQIEQAISEKRVGDILGYGISSRPAGDVAVTVRSADGLEKQSAVTDGARLEETVKAAHAVADPEDVVDVEPAEKVVVSRILQKAAREMVDAREPVPKGIVDQFPAGTFALPEGYRLEGDAYIYEGGAEKLTPEQQDARENAQAMAELRAQKAESGQNEDPDWSVAEAPERTERPQPGVPSPIYGERPPDILDWINDHFTGGVRTTSKADYGRYVDEATGRSRELVSNTKGEPADKVLKAMHEEGLYSRIDSEDALLNRAAEGRKGWREQQRKSKDAVEAWFDQAIEATKPGVAWTGEASMGLLRVPVWLTQEAANGALRIAKLAYTTTRDLAQAIGAAVEHVKGMNLKGFDSGALQQWLTESLGERQTGEKIGASPVISDPVKQAIGEYLYERRTNATDEELARQVVQQFGAEGAARVVTDPPAGMAQATVSKLLGEVTREWARQEAAARRSGDTAGADGLARKQAELWDRMLPKITEMAQGLQALTDIVDMSPDAQVARLKRKIDERADEAVRRRGAETEQLRGAIEQGRAQGVEAVRQDPAVNGAARAAVDEAVAKNPEVNQAVVMELAGPWSESPHILANARQLVRERADEMLQADRVPAPRRAEYLRQALGDLSKRAATIFAGHLQGAEPGKGIVAKFQERLGLSEPKAKELAASLQKEWAAQLKAARAKLPKRIATMRATRERNAGESLNSPTAAVDARIRRELDALNVKLGQVLRQEAERRDQTGQHVAERVVQASGLEGEAADTLRTTLQNRWDAIVTDAQRRTLEQMERASGVKVGRPLKGTFDKLVELDRLGALTSERFYEVVKQGLKLKELTPADAQALRAAVQKAQALPEGYLRQQAAGEVLKLTERLSGNLRWWDVPLGIFYANILSGLTTPAKIALENVNLLASGTVAALIARPRELMHPVDLARSLAGAYGRGLKKGGAQALGTLRSGVVSGVWAEPRVPTILELKPFGEKMEPLNFWKWFTRVISTAHETTFKPAWELKQTLTAREVARRDGLSGKALEQRVADLMANTDTQVEAARTQAADELRAAGQMDRANMVRRTGEILEQQRERNMPGSTEGARDFALRTAYLNEPYGLLGVIAKGIRQTLETARKQYPMLGMGVKTQVPFTTVIANILNEKLNWTPVGLARAAVSHKTGEIYGRPALPGERAELYAKAVLGTIALGVMGELFGDHIHGNGPSDPNKRKQLQAAGWVPHSIEIGGKYFSYMNTPAGLGLAVIGNVLDWHRYGKGDEADGVNRLSFAAKATINAIISQGILDSLKRVFEALGSESTTEGAEKLQRLTARTASSFVFPNLLQQVDRIFDPTMYDQTGMEALLKSQVPFVRRNNKPALTVLGDPVQAGPFHYWAGQVTDDPLLRLLAAKQAWVPAPSRNQIIGDRTRGPDHFRAMTPDEYYTFIATSGPEIRRRLSENLDKITDLDPDQARKFVAQIAEQEHAHAKAKKLFE